MIFFEFSSKLLNSTFQAAPIGLKNITDPSGKKFTDDKRLILGNYGEIHFPVVCKHVSGKNLTDVLDTGFHILYLISDRFKLALEENKLNGWKTFPIILLDKKDNPIEGYHGFSIIGRCGLLDYSQSRTIYKQIVPDGPLWLYRKGYQFHLNEWDGSDFFLPKGTYTICVTEKVAYLIKKIKFTNVSVNNINDIEISEEDISTDEKNMRLSDEWLTD
ncbi:MAG: hypothetical protein KGJ02_07530 [Verrucomicrobiota bacterium]|nr:hypothetical protein [Verrucomicrobiota bacterium]